MLVIRNGFIGVSKTSFVISANLTYPLFHHFETVPNSKKLQMTTEMWLLKDFKIKIA